MEIECRRCLPFLDSMEQPKGRLQIAAGGGEGRGSHHLTDLTHLHVRITEVLIAN
jgi:hypothetical protein